MPVRIARIKKKQRQRGQREGETGLPRKCGARRAKGGGPQEKERREDEEALRRVQEETEKHLRRREGNAEDARGGERSKPRRVLVRGGQLEHAAETNGVVCEKSGREWQAARHHGQRAPRRGNRRTEKEDGPGHRRRIFRKDREAEERAGGEVASKPPGRVPWEKQRRPRSEEARRHERVGIEEKTVSEERRREEQREHRDSGARPRRAEEHGRPEEQIREESRGQRRAKEPHGPQDGTHRGGGRRPCQRPGEEVTRQRHERRPGRLVRIDPAVFPGDVLEGGPEERQDARNLGCALLDERCGERPAREFVRRKKMRKDRHREKRQENVEAQDRPLARLHASEV